MSGGSLHIELHTPIVFRRHALDRYIERVRPAMDHVAAERDLRRVCEFGGLTARPPEWMVWDERATLYLELADVVFPLRASSKHAGMLEAVTCLVRGSLNVYARRRRTAVRGSRAWRPRAKPRHSFDEQLGPQGLHGRNSKGGGSHEKYR